MQVQIVLRSNKGDDYNYRAQCHLSEKDISIIDAIVISNAVSNLGDDEVARDTIDCGEN
jgi:hypothetical protein